MNKNSISSAHCLVLFCCDVFQPVSGMHSTYRTQRRRSIPELMKLLSVPVTGTENNRCDRNFAPGHGEGNDGTILDKKLQHRLSITVRAGNF